MVKGSESSEGGNRAALRALAEQLLDNPEQLAHYDTAKWNLIGHPDPERRGDGAIPRLTRRTGEGAVRMYTLDVFSGVCVDEATLLTIRKARWAAPDEPSTWLAMQVNLETGETLQRDIWSARVDAVHQMWLEIAPPGACKQPIIHGAGSLFRSRSSQEQHRIEARLDEDWRTSMATFRAGMYGGAAHYMEVAALESMIITVQELRALQSAAEAEQSGSSVALAA